MNIFKTAMTFLGIYLMAFSVYAQQHELPFKRINLTSLEDFRSPSENWQLSDSVYMDLNKYRHTASTAAGAGGLLVNTRKGEDLFTRWSHGDIDLELEFMMAKESNSGIYFQGRYELQLYDSWGVEHPYFGDLGGIYEWWDDGQGGGGTPPRVNAARAPGLWQHLEIKFRAPRFNGEGKKIADARFEEVLLNGVMIHQNVEVNRPTRGAVSKEEVRQAPLRIQGDHGPVAFRNIRYKTYDRKPPRLRDITYQYVEGEFEEASELAQEDATATGTVNELDLSMLRAADHFGIVYQGSLRVEQAGDYFFQLQTEGGNRLVIDNDTLIQSDVYTRQPVRKSARVYLPEGVHPVELSYFKDVAWNDPVLQLFVEGPQIEKSRISAPTAATSALPQAPMIVDPKAKPWVQRGFIRQRGQVFPHTAAVGFPGDVHVGYNLASGKLLTIWKGIFINAGPIWKGRGGGSLEIPNNALPLAEGPPIAHLENPESPWPDSLQPQLSYRFGHYQSKNNRTTIFYYRLGALDVSDQLRPSQDSLKLHRALSISSKKEQPLPLYFRLARAKEIAQLPNGLYQVGDYTYYLRLEGGISAKARIRQSNGVQELIVPVSEENMTINYTYIW